jgi:hypothetical protein
MDLIETGMPAAPIEHEAKPLNGGAAAETPDRPANSQADSHHRQAGRHSRALQGTIFAGKSD